MNLRVAVLSLVISISSVVSQATERTIQEYWAATGIGFDTVFEKHINSILCHLTPEQFMGCIQGLNAMSSLTTPPTQLIPVSQLEERRAEYTSVQHRFGPIAWVVKNAEYEVPSTGRGRAADFEAFKARRDAELAALRAAPQQGYVDFDYLLSHLRGQFRDRNSQALAAATAINSQIAFITDPHSRISPMALDEESAQNAGESFVGVGATLTIMNQRPVITQITPNSPAERADVRAFDEILSVDGFNTREQDLAEVTTRIRGAEGTTVTLRLRRSGRVITKRITRAKIEIQNVTSRVLSFARQNVAVIKLNSFIDVHACDAIKQEIQTLSSANRLDALVLDLRGNLGGFVDQAVCIAGIFLGRGKTVLTARTLSGELIEAVRTRESALTRLPMITLLNAASASASELLAGALQDHERSWIAGQRSYGKGTMQGSTQYQNASGINYWRTMARFYQPSGRTNQIVGILPDFEIAPKANATAEDLFALREGDLYTNPFQALGATWTQPRPEDVQSVTNRCSGYERRAENASTGRNRQAPTTDYQLHAAAELALCAAAN